jgi:hypothetical protein
MIQRVPYSHKPPKKKSLNLISWINEHELKCAKVYIKNTQMIFYFIELKCKNMEIEQ